MWGTLCALLLFVLIPKGLGEDYVINDRPFPDNFMFGAATAAYQIEGGWDADGKGESIWDRFSHEHPSYFPNGDNADVTCDSYNKYEDDIANLKYLGVNHYRFSISWARILPNGLSDQINEKGIQYYKNLIKGLKANNIEPLVTLYHFDLPQALQDQGGFHNDSFQQWFSEYARVCFENFGDDVTYWITFNEPSSSCLGYGAVYFAPGVDLPGVGEYICIHNLIKAHAAAYHVYQDKFKSRQNGKLSMAQAISQHLPLTDDPLDVSAAEQAMEFKLGWIADPVYYGDYPEIMKERIAYRSKAEGYPQSRLPAFTEEEKQFIRGTSDYFAINTYGTSFVQHIEEPEIGTPSTVKDAGVGVTEATGTEKTLGMTQLMIWVTKRYNRPDIIITENGLDTTTNSLEDDDRISLLQDAMSHFKDAIDQNINVFGYTVWSLMDNFEWNYAYSKKYGVFYVDFDSDNRTRTAKKSAGWYKNVIATKCLVDKCQ